MGFGCLLECFMVCQNRQYSCTAAGLLHCLAHAACHVQLKRQGHVLAQLGPPGHRSNVLIYYNYIMGVLPSLVPPSLRGLRCKMAALLRVPLVRLSGGFLRLFWCAAAAPCLPCQQCCSTGTQLTRCILVDHCLLRVIRCLVPTAALWWSLNAEV